MCCLLQGLFSIILSIRITKQIQFLNSHVFSFGTFVKVSFESTIFTKLSDRREVRLWLHPGLGPSTRGFRILLAGSLYFLPICGFLVPQLSAFSNSSFPLQLSQHFESQLYVQWGVMKRNPIVLFGRFQQFLLKFQLTPIFMFLVSFVESFCCLA